MAETEWFAVMTLQRPLLNGGFATGTRSQVLRVSGPSATRAALFEHMRGLFPPEFATANVVFFSAEPNQIGGERS